MTEDLAASLVAQAVQSWIDVGIPFIVFDPESKVAHDVGRVSVNGPAVQLTIKP